MQKKNPWLLIATLFTITLSLPTALHAQYTFKVLYNFGSFSTDAHVPEFPMVLDAAGNLYGTTTTNGGVVTGAAYKLSPSAGGAWTESIIYTFPENGGPILPSSGLTFDGAGNLYGVSSGGGSANAGTVYKLSPGASGWTVTVLHSFSGGTDGVIPDGSLIFDASGNLFGTTHQGGGAGCSPSGCGTVFELSPSGSGWTYRVLYSFTGGLDGWIPGSLKVDATGNLFGAASFAGNTACRSGCGTIFRLQPASGSYTFGRIYSFTPLGPAGFNPVSVTLDAAGNIYGSTTGGGGRCGTPGCGTVFKLTKPASAGLWKASVLHAFTGTFDGGFPVSVTLDSSGNVFGTTGLGSLTSAGVVFKITPVSGGWIFAVIHSFGADDGHPDSGVTVDSLGNLFGNTGLGGQFNLGEAYELSPR